jgi:hypothetical protein
MMGPPSTATTCYSLEYSDCVQEYSLFFLMRVIYLLSLFYTLTCNPCPVSEGLLFPFLGYLLVVFI